MTGERDSVRPAPTIMQGAMSTKRVRRYTAEGLGLMGRRYCVRRRREVCVVRDGTKGVSRGLITRFLLEGDLSLLREAPGIFPDSSCVAVSITSTFGKLPEMEVVSTSG